MGPRLRIGQAARETGLNPKTIRYYEEIGLIPRPERTERYDASPGYRLFGQEDLNRLEFIRRARLLGLSLAEVKELLNAGRGEFSGSSYVRLRELLQEKTKEVSARIQELEELRVQLMGLQRKLEQDKGSEAECCEPTCSPLTCE